jgi:hypothetical protein
VGEGDVCPAGSIGQPTKVNRQEEIVMRRVSKTKRCLCVVRIALVAVAIGGLAGTAAGRDAVMTSGRPNRGMGDEWPARYAIDTPTTLAVAPLPADGTGLPAVTPSGSVPSEHATPDGSTGK